MSDTCKYCDKPIERIPFGGWAHTIDRRSLCANAHTLATPKEAR